MSNKYTPDEQKSMRGVLKLFMVLLVISATVSVIVFMSGGGILAFLITFAVLSFMSMGIAGIATIFTTGDKDDKPQEPEFKPFKNNF